ncbi:GNAT family protein [Gracilibacillus sp. S3-1-1]|uniref:GNAT family protein n=1 Tax=Gracilibacillus pellucidus TaxID=3095368 RepID=A0ACC6M6R9_9BACI|nr:GNAT family protein [Gracilibacillus sp. S3-1-1]MDX8046671.1 GNAT family protein [Gracilibacillus sp. S3-1-1]
MFSSQRISLRKVDRTDAEKYHIWRNDMEVMSYTNLSLDQYTIEDTQHFVESVLMDASSSKSYMIVDNEENLSIGITSLIHIDGKNRNAECIIDIGEKQYWGNGYGKEALSLLLDFAFNELNLHRISLNVFSFNKRAIHVYQSLGFIQEGTSRQALFRNGQWHDIIQMGILQAEWSNN